MGVHGRPPSQDRFPDRCCGLSSVTELHQLFRGVP